ncbi:NAD(P)H-flavin reductase [Salinivibrio kushneri]|uniref:NAD(P)H-flavin reductase n=1 Tax=Salinivibrio kushneri TaxID=1908198 RepID=UPI0022B3F381|nr:NAD(P)H-flavin reductase [Salinivibrio kushneri]WBA11718.1 NAD(P)H-flavin reductase [Salinivibrio kushneri]WBA17980.1 NAD(P)H-flavin reductase [Salinivibrio kushneri]
MSILCEVTAVEPLACHTYRIVLKPQQAVSYQPGQYVMAVMGEKDKRPFSLASSPCREGGAELELHVGAADENPFALEVVEKAKAVLESGEASFEITEPAGDAWLRESERPLLLIAGGTGFSYVRSMVEHCINQGIQSPIFIYWGARNPCQLYAHDELQALSESHRNITFMPVVEQAEGEWRGKVGNVLEAVMEDFVSLGAYDIYIAGRFEMAGVARDMFCKERGVSRDHLYSDAFAFI